MKIVIVGSGVVGVTTAYYAAKKGFEVKVVDAITAANKCSYANGGQISVCNSQVWNSWSNVRKAMKWLGKENAPLLIRPDFDPDRYVWLMKFMGEIFLGRQRENTHKTIQLGLEARHLYSEIFDTVPGLASDTDHANHGILHLYTQMKDYTAALELQTEFEQAGLTWTDVPVSKLVSLEPRLISFVGLVGGIYTPEDSTGDAHRFCRSLLKYLQDQHGVELAFNQTINSLDELLGLEADRYVICTGTGLQQMGHWFGENLNIYPVKGYSLTIESDVNNLPKISLLDEHAKIVSSTLGNRFRVAGTAEFAGHDETMNQKRMQPLYDWVDRNFVGIRTSHHAESWTCLRPMRPDMLPIWGKFRNSDSVYYNGGHGHLGWTLAPATAMKVINQICNSLS